jgi:hypothetical protein
MEPGSGTFGAAEPRAPGSDLSLVSPLAPLPAEPQVLRANPTTSLASTSISSWRP